MRSKPFSTETWEALSVKLGWHVGHGLAIVLVVLSWPFPRWRERLRRWAWSK